jgi:hypothetical protein
MDNFLLIYSLERNQDDRMKEAEKGGIWSTHALTYGLQINKY